MHAGGLRDQIGAFATALTDRGYAPSTTREYVRLAAHLGRWIEREQLSVVSLDETHVGRFLAHRRRRGRKTRSNTSTLRLLLELMREMGVSRAHLMKDAETHVGPIARVESEFASYLTEERGLSVSTRLNYVPIARSLLLGRFGTGPVEMGNLRSDDSPVSFCARRGW